jgi:hypothetical protein
MKHAMPDEQRALANLNAVCPYFTMFPIDFPLSILRRAVAGLVVDPFCGRGTTNLAARQCGLLTIGIDSSRVAAAATAAKLTSALVKPDAIVALAAELVARGSHVDMPHGEFWELAYHPTVLRDLCAIRSQLINECRSDASKALRGVVLGALHGPRRRNGSSSYLSNQAPHTYAPKPRYAAKFWRERSLMPPHVDVIQIIRERAHRAFSTCLPPVRSRTRCADSRRINWGRLVDGMGPIKWVITSPPYYGLRTYRPDQWLREWFLGASSEVTYSCKGQVQHASPEIFAEDLRVVWNGLAGHAAADARMVIRFGAINDRPVNAEDLIRASLRRSGWRVRRIKPAGVASSGRRQVLTFSQRTMPAFQEIDVWCSIR